MEQDYTEIILKIINEKTAISDIDLVLKMMGLINGMTFDRLKYDSVLRNLISKDQILEMRYEVDGRIRLLYFPKGTKFHIHGYGVKIG